MVSVAGFLVVPNGAVPYLDCMLLATACVIGGLRIVSKDCKELLSADYS